MSTKERDEDSHSSLDADVLLDEGDDEGDQVHIPDADEEPVQPTKPATKRRLTKGKAKPVKETEKKPAAKERRTKEVTSKVVAEGEDDVPDDAEKELPGDQEYNAEAGQSQDEEEDSVSEEPERTNRGGKGDGDHKVDGLTKKMKKHDMVVKVVNVAPNPHQGRM